LTFGLSAKNTAQKIDSRAINGSTQSEPGGVFQVYTCPTGQRAKIKGTVNVDSFGAGTQVLVQIDSAELIRLILATDSPTDIPEVSLEAGESLELNPNVGTNADIEFALTVVESPA